MFSPWSCMCCSNLQGGNLWSYWTINYADFMAGSHVSDYLHMPFASYLALVFTICLWPLFGFFPFMSSLWFTIFIFLPCNIKKLCFFLPIMLWVLFENYVVLRWIHLSCSTGTHGMLICCSGILIRTLADASHERRALSAPQIVFNVVGFCATVATTIIITMYAKKQLKVLQEEELLLQ